MKGKITQQPNGSTRVQSAFYKEQTFEGEQGHGGNIFQVIFYDENNEILDDLGWSVDFHRAERYRFEYQRDAKANIIAQIKKVEWRFPVVIS
jgi:hypothetical protein